MQNRFRGKCYVLNIAITFDYELFLGKNYYDSTKVLFEPTERIIKILSDKGVSATFFADVCSVFQHDKYGLNNYSIAFAEQLQTMVRENEDVQLHIHPNWLRSRFENGQWKFDQASYRIHFFDGTVDDTWTIDSIVERGVDYLNRTLIPIKHDYKCIAYRAGGFAVQPYEKLFASLQRRGIVIDSSVVINDYLFHAITGYDFRDIPKQLGWWISRADMGQACQREDEKCTGIFEVPILTVKNSIVERIFYPKRKRTFRKGMATGTPIQIQTAQKQDNSAVGKVKRLLNYNQTYRRLSMDAMNADYLYKKLEKIFYEYDAENKDVYAAILGHPKAFTGDAFDNFSQLIDLLLLEKERVRIVNMTDIYRQIVVNDSISGIFMEGVSSE